MKNEWSNLLFFLGYIVLGISLGSEFTAAVGWGVIAIGLITHALINRGENDE